MVCPNGVYLVQSCGPHTFPLALQCLDLIGHKKSSTADMTSFTFQSYDGGSFFVRTKMSMGHI